MLGATLTLSASASRFSRCCLSSPTTLPSYVTHFSISLTHQLDEIESHNDLPQDWK